MKLVLDTNVLVSGIFWGGRPGKLLDDWVAGHHVLLVTPPILLEYSRVISELSATHDPVLALRWSRLLTETGVMVIPVPATVECRDPKDQMFLECAIGGSADYLVSGDKDLLSLISVADIPIVTAQQVKTKP